jgi:uncharacterized Zn finger protein
MIKGKKGAIWSWNYNFGRSYPMPCDKCGELVEMEIISFGNPFKLVKCPVCQYVKKKSNKV